MADEKKTELDEKKETTKKEIEEKFSQLLKRQYDRGIKVGMASFAEVTLKKLNNTSVSLADRIDDVKKFCAIPINDIKKLREEESKAKKE